MFVFGGNNGGIRDDYKINNSLRFRSSASARLSRTFASSSGTTNTWSFWIKRGTLGVAQHIFSWTNLSTTSMQLVFDAGDTFTFANVAGGAVNAALTTTQVFRDSSAWYHIVFVLDTTQATAANRLKLYVNGVQVTAFGTATYPAQNTAMAISTSAAWAIGARGGANDIFFDGYMSEFNFIDGQALTPSSFGYTHPKTGVWRPKPFTGTYGTNGFYLKFSDIATTSGSNAGLGKDFSGNSNYWTTNNISVTAGTTYDAMTDSPTLGASASNYAVLSPIDKGTSATILNANLSLTSGAAHAAVRGTFSANKIYFEATNTSITSGSSVVAIGLATSSANLSATPVSLAQFWGVYASNAHGIVTNGTTVSFGAASSVGTIFQLAYDPSTGNGWVGENNVWYNSTGGTTGNPSAGTNPTFTITVGTEVFPYIETYSNTMSATFGQRPFAYTPPTGFKALNTYNLPNVTIPKGNKVMDATLWTGDGTTRSITNASSFKPDFVWVKSRSNSSQNELVDSVRGANGSVMRTLFSNQTGAEQTVNTDADLQYGLIASINSNGFTVGPGSANAGQTNYPAYTYVGWQWQAGQGSTSSNTNGSITSTVSVNTTAGFSVVTYTGVGGTGTVGHGLGVAPKFIITKYRNIANAWYCYHASTGAGNVLFLNQTNASTADTGVWNNTSPTSSVFSVGSLNTNQSTGTYVAYCWAEIAGFSKFGSYTGNGSADGTFVYLGFRPKFIMYKRTNLTGSWGIFDTSRNTYNLSKNVLYANLADAEYTSTGAGFDNIDILSNGFKPRQTNSGINASGSTYIYMAFAENPFKYSLAR